MKKELVKEIQAIIKAEGLNCKVEEFAKSVIWARISIYCKLSHEFLRKFIDLVDWWNVSIYQRLTPKAIREFADKLDWLMVCRCQHLTPGLIQQFYKRLDWRVICERHRLTPKLIRQFADRLDWVLICEHQRLTPALIREFADRLYWPHVAKYQKLNDSLISEFRDRLDLKLVNQYQRIGPKLRRELGLPMPENNWLYKSVEDKREYLKSLDLYEFKEQDTILAYKGIKRTRQSKYDPRYIYEPGQVYTAHCDCTANQNSFGLSAWTKSAAWDYCDELVVPVEIKLRDIGRVLPNGKIRCRRLKVLA